MSRLQPIVDKFTGIEKPDDTMLEILDAIQDTKTILPEEGGFYTFVYLPKTPLIQYDEFPLIACMEINRWGFRGFNYHWNQNRNYTWNEVIGEFHELSVAELKDARRLSYAKFKLNT